MLKFIGVHAWRAWLSSVAYWVLLHIGRRSEHREKVGCSNGASKPVFFNFTHFMWHVGRHRKGNGSRRGWWDTRFAMHVVSGTVKVILDVPPAFRQWHSESTMKPFLMQVESKVRWQQSMTITRILNTALTLGGCGIAVATKGGMQRWQHCNGCMGRTAQHCTGQGRISMTLTITLTRNATWS